MSDEKCLYCYMEENGDIPSDRESIVDIAIDLDIDQNTVAKIDAVYSEEFTDGIRREINKETKYEHDSKLKFRINTVSSIDNDKLCIMSWMDDGSGKAEVFSTCEEAKINYCPMCGKKLHSDNATEKEVTTCR